MRLVAAPDGAVTHTDAAIWLTMPFDTTWLAVTDMRACLTVSDALAYTLTVSDTLAFTLTVTDTDACDA